MFGANFEIGAKRAVGIGCNAHPSIDRWVVKIMKDIALFCGGVVEVVFAFAGFFHLVLAFFALQIAHGVHHPGFDIGIDLFCDRPIEIDPDIPNAKAHRGGGGDRGQAQRGLHTRFANVVSEAVEIGIELLTSTAGLGGRLVE